MLSTKSERHMSRNKETTQFRGTCLCLVRWRTDY